MAQVPEAENEFYVTPLSFSHLSHPKCTKVNLSIHLFTLPLCACPLYTAVHIHPLVPSVN